MNSQVKQKWVNALRSGEYSQAQEKLRSTNGFCCLGILCDLYGKEHNVNWKFNGLWGEEEQPGDCWYFEECSEFLPVSVRDWAELNSVSPKIEDELGTIQLSELNDEGYTFNTIANLIETKL